MKIEKLNENKIKIIFDNKDLEENNISFHSFMSNSIESQSIFSNILDEAEKKVGFKTDNHKISIETLTLNNGNFILIITRLGEKANLNIKKYIHTHRKQNNNINKISLYKFNSFEDFCSFCSFVKKYSPEIIYEFNNKNSLYEYKNKYYLLINKLSLNITTLKLCSIITEFASFSNLTTTSFQKMKEYGNLLINNDAVNNCISIFSL